MGVYDYLVDGDKEAQVKVWDCELRSYSVGDKVHPVNGELTYVLALREGGFAFVNDLRFVGIIDEWRNSSVPIFDKYGAGWTGPDHYTEGHDVYGQMVKEVLAARE